MSKNASMRDSARLVTFSAAESQARCPGVRPPLRTCGAAKADPREAGLEPSKPGVLEERSYPELTTLT